MPQLTAADLCAQCASNAQWNETGGYLELAEECRNYCRRGHRDSIICPECGFVQLAQAFHDPDCSSRQGMLCQSETIN